jgi:hypothetical protein
LARSDAAGQKVCRRQPLIGHLKADVECLNILPMPPADAINAALAAAGYNFYLLICGLGLYDCVS